MRTSAKDNDTDAKNAKLFKSTDLDHVWVYVHVC